MLDLLGKEVAGKVSEAVSKEVASGLFGVGKYIVKYIKSRKKFRDEKLACISHKEIDLSYQYSKLIVDNYVERRFKNFKNGAKSSFKTIKSEIESLKLDSAQNIIIIGQAGTGKTTVLKRLFVNSRARFHYVYLTAKLFLNCKTIEEVCNSIKNELEIELAKNQSSENEQRRCLVFFDGLDELKCVKGKQSELEDFIKFFDNQSDRKSNHKFIIATRAEHFHLKSNIYKRDYDFDNYSVFEIQPLNEKEAFKVCKSIKHFAESDALKGFKHFVNKYPIKNIHTRYPKLVEDYNYPLPETIYLKKLKSYINQSKSDDSLLSCALLCRYAYQIICVHNGFGFNEINNNANENYAQTQSGKVEQAIRSFIKWEFYDQSEYKIKKSPKTFETHKNKTFKFLALLAFNMGLNNTIEIERWKTLKGKSMLNSALCVLHEDNDGNLTFMHKLFKDFFLAVYYAETLTDVLNKEASDNFCTLINLKPNFARMYVEQLLVRGSDISKKICVRLIEKNHELLRNNPELLEKNYDDSYTVSKFATGDKKFIYSQKETFTIEDYINVFPNGAVEFAGFVFDKFSLAEFILTGALEIFDADSLSEFNAEQICANPNVTMVKVVVNVFESLREYLFVYQNGECFFEDGIYRFDYDQNLKPILNEEEITLEDFYNNMFSEISRSVLAKLSIRSTIYYANEKEKIRRFMDNMMNFFDSEKTYWCLYGESLLSVAQTDTANAKRISDLFKENASNSKSKHDYIYIYGKYNSEISKNADSFCFLDVKNIDFEFTPIVDELKYESHCLKDYYDLYWVNTILYKNKTEVIKINDENAHAVTKIAEQFQQFERVELKLENEPNEKLELMISDQKLLTLYITGKGEEFVELAKNTLELCDKYNHDKGRQFREFLIDDDTGYSKKDVEKVAEFATKYVWI